MSPAGRALSLQDELSTSDDVGLSDIAQRRALDKARARAKDHLTRMQTPT
jgi:hypothetical protein